MSNVDEVVRLWEMWWGRGRYRNVEHAPRVSKHSDALIGCSCGWTTASEDELARHAAAVEASKKWEQI